MCALACPTQTGEENLPPAPGSDAGSVGSATVASVVRFKDDRCAPPHRANCEPDPARGVNSVPKLFPSRRSLPRARLRRLRVLMRHSGTWRPSQWVG